MAIVDSIKVEDVRAQIFNGTVNPLANMICVFLAFQVSKNNLSKGEAKFVIASSVDVLNTAEISEDIRELGADMLMRMINAIDRMIVDTTN